MNHNPEDDFCEHYLEMAFCTTRRKRPATFDGYGRKGRECGDALEVFLDIKDGVITSVHYYSLGCFATNACGNALAELIIGTTTAQAVALTPNDLATFLQTLPEHELHCAEMAVAALNQALTDHADKA